MQLAVRASLVAARGRRSNRCLVSGTRLRASYDPAVIPVWAFLAVTVPLVLTPGASTAVVLRNSLAGGTRAGLETAIGANAGSLVYGLLCAFGFSFALQQWPGAWIVLRAVGVAYLGWLGLRSLYRAVAGAGHAGALAVAEAERPATRRQNVKDGFVTNVANPALATFYFILLPQFIPTGAAIVPTALMLTALHISLALTWHAVWAAAGGTLAAALGAGRPRQVLDLITGLALVALAVRLAIP
jgi:threonine/homoserine/homoserine lactone efflux protein